MKNLSNFIKKVFDKWMICALVLFFASGFLSSVGEKLLNRGLPNFVGLLFSASSVICTVGVFVCVAISFRSAQNNAADSTIYTLLFKGMVVFSLIGALIGILIFLSNKYGWKQGCSEGQYA